VVIPYHNEGALLESALASVEGQTYPGPIEVIVVDDASETPPLLSREFATPVKIVRSERNLLPAGARNLGVAHATGELICFLDADDLYSPERVETHVAFLQRSPEVVFVGSPSTVHRPTASLHVPKVIREFFPQLQERECVLPESVRRCCALEYLFHTGAMTLRSRAFGLMKGFETSYRWGEEWDLQVRLAQQGRVGYIPVPSFHYICRENSVCTTVNPEKQVSHARMSLAWLRAVAGLTPADRRRLRLRARDALLLAAQVYFEHRRQPRAALGCVVESLKCGLSIWGARSLLRCSLELLRSAWARDVAALSPP
jgi:glycosyltransferase involved in cell wall biosynthesis